MTAWHRLWRELLHGMSGAELDMEIERRAPWGRRRRRRRRGETLRRMVPLLAALLWRGAEPAVAAPEEDGPRLRLQPGSGRGAALFAALSELSRRLGSIARRRGIGGRAARIP